MVIYITHWDGGETENDHNYLSFEVPEGAYR
jgi:hypothetical protein